MLKVILIISVVFIGKVYFLFTNTYDCLHRATKMHNSYIVFFCIVGIKANCSNRYHDQSCSHGRLYRNGNSCTSYFQCSYNRMFHCKCGMYRGSSYLIFDEARQRCEWAGQRWGEFLHKFLRFTPSLWKF